MSDRQGIASIRLHPWHRMITYVVLLVIALTGLAWTVLEDYLDLGPGPLPLLLLKAHGIFSFLTLMVFGALMPTHMRLAWRHRRNVITGWLTAAIMMVVVVTAAGLYYGSEELRELTKWTHVVIGLTLFAALPVHVLRGRRARLRLHAR